MPSMVPSSPSYVGSLRYPAASPCVVIMCMMLLLFAVAVPTSAQPAINDTTLGNAVITGFTTISYLLFDPRKRTLFLVGNRPAIYTVADVSNAPVSPLLNVPWGATSLAGGLSAGAASNIEVIPSAARFNTPLGLIGWPGPSGTTPQVWKGIFVMDRSNAAVRLIHFYRGNNVTTVAGSTAGFTDGIGSSSRLNNMKGGARLRIRTSDAIQARLLPAAEETLPGASINNYYKPYLTTLLWPDEGSHCIRQGIPLDNATLRLFSDYTPSNQLVLNVSTFLGLCTVAGTSSASGMAYLAAVLKSPTGIAFMDPFPTGNISSVVAVITDYGNGRLTFISPLWPPESRWLWSTGSLRFPTTFTVGTIRPFVMSTLDPTTGEPVPISTVELFVATTGPSWHNVTLFLRWTPGNGSVIPYANSTNILWAVRAGTTAMHVIFVPYFGGGGVSPSSPRTMVLLCGSGSYVMQFYCCLNASEYSTPQKDFGLTSSRSLLVTVTDTRTRTKPIPPTLSSLTATTTRTLTRPIPPTHSSLTPTTTLTQTVLRPPTGSSTFSFTKTLTLTRPIPRTRSTLTMTVTRTRTRPILPTISSLTTTTTLSRTDLVPPTRSSVTASKSRSLSLVPRFTVTGTVSGPLSPSRSQGNHPGEQHTAECLPSSAVPPSAYLPETLGSCCAQQEVWPPTGVASNCTVRLSLCLERTTGGDANALCDANEPTLAMNATYWVTVCAGEYMDCLVASVMSIPAGVAAARPCPFALRLRQESSDAMYATNVTATALYDSCALAVRNISMRIVQWASSAPCSSRALDRLASSLGRPWVGVNGTVEPSTQVRQIEQKLCSRLSPATMLALRGSLNATMFGSSAVFSYGISLVEPMWTLRMLSSSQRSSCEVCEAATVQSKVGTEGQILGQVLVEAAAAAKSNNEDVDPSIQQAAVSGCDGGCGGSAPHRSVISGLPHPTALRAPMSDTCHRAAFNLSMCSQAPDIGLFLEAGSVASGGTLRRQFSTVSTPDSSGAASCLQFHPSTGRCVCPSGTDRFIFSVAQVTPQGMQPANLSLCLRGADAFLMVHPSGTADRSDFFQEVNAVSLNGGGGSRGIANLDSFCVPSYNRSSRCTCRPNASETGEERVPSVSGVQLIYAQVNQTVRRMLPAVLFVCTGTPLPPPLQLDSFSSVTIAASVLTAIFGGPALESMQAADIISSVDCSNVHQLASKRQSSAVPFRIGTSPVGGIYFLWCIVFGVWGLHTVIVLVRGTLLWMKQRSTTTIPLSSPPSGEAPPSQNKDDVAPRDFERVARPSSMPLTAEAVGRTVVVSETIPPTLEQQYAAGQGVSTTNHTTEQEGRAAEEEKVSGAAGNDDNDDDNYEDDDGEEGEDPQQLRTVLSLSSMRIGGLRRLQSLRVDTSGGSMLSPEAPVLNTSIAWSPISSPKRWGSYVLNASPILSPMSKSSIRRDDNVMFSFTSDDSIVASMDAGDNENTNGDNDISNNNQGSSSEWQDFGMVAASSQSQRPASLLESSFVRAGSMKLPTSNRNGFQPLAASSSSFAASPRRLLVVPKDTQRPLTTIPAVTAAPIATTTMPTMATTVIMPTASPTTSPELTILEAFHQAAVAVQYPSLTLRVWYVCFQGLTFEAVRILASAYNQPIDPSDKKLVLTAGEAAVTLMTALWSVIFILFVLSMSIQSGNRFRRLQRAAEEERENRVVPFVPPPAASSALTMTAPLDDDKATGRSAYTSGNENGRRDQEYGSSDGGDDDIGKLHETAKGTGVETIPPPNNGMYTIYVDAAYKKLRRVRPVLSHGFWPTTDPYNAKWSAVYRSFQPQWLLYASGVLPVVQGTFVATFVPLPISKDQCVIFFCTLASLLCFVSLMVLVVRPHRWLLDSLFASVMIGLTGAMTFAGAFPAAFGGTSTKLTLRTFMFAVAMTSVTFSMIHFTLDFLFRRWQREAEESAAPIDTAAEAVSGVAATGESNTTVAAGVQDSAEAPIMVTPLDRLITRADGAVVGLSPSARTNPATTTTSTGTSEGEASAPSSSASSPSKASRHASFSLPARSLSSSLSFLKKQSSSSSGSFPPPPPPSSSLPSPLGRSQSLRRATQKVRDLGEDTFDDYLEEEDEAWGAVPAGLKLTTSGNAHQDNIGSHNIGAIRRGGGTSSAATATSDYPEMIHPFAADDASPMKEEQDAQLEAVDSLVASHLDNLSGFFDQLSGPAAAANYDDDD